MLNHINLLKIKNYKKVSISGLNKNLCIKLYKLMFRIRLCEVTGKVLKFGMELLGIEMPERM